MIFLDKLGLYIHIPFCVKKCNYCDFNSYGGSYQKEPSYFRALFKEIKEKAPLYKDYSVDTIYIGGGTPTSVKPENITELMALLKKSFNVEKCAEITIECNPKTAQKSDFEKYLKADINRLSIGLQSTHPHILNTLGRIHSSEDFKECLKDAKNAGFENISADLMFALPDQTIKNWEETLNEVCSYSLSHISCYGLKIEEGTPFSKMNLNLPDEDTEADMYDTAVRILAENGYNRYEISNFSLPGKESRHNLKYWSLMPYLGFGAGAYSSINGERFSNVRSMDLYISRSNTKEDAAFLSKNEQMSEFVFMGLRTVKGIDINDFYEKFSVDIFAHFKAPLEKYLKLGVLLTENNRIYINEKMLYISNSILCDFV